MNNPQKITEFINAFEKSSREVEALRKSEARLQLQIDRMPIGCIVWNPEFRAMSWNPAAEEIFGFTAGEAMGKHPYDIIVPKNVQPHVDTIWRRLQEGDTTAHSVNENMTKDGRIIICAWSNTPLKEADGTVVGVFSMVQDITERKKAEEALQESEKRYKKLVEFVTDYIYTVKVENGRAISTSHGPGCLAVTGYTFEYFKIYPHLWYQMIHKEDRKEVLEQAEKILSGKTVQPLEHRIIHKDGSIRWVRNTPVPYYDKDGYLIAYDGVITDITERKQAEEALNKSYTNLEMAKKEWEETFDAIGDLLFIHDKEFRIVRANKAYAEAAGMLYNNFIGKPYYKIFPEMEGPFKMCLREFELQAEEEVYLPSTEKVYKVKFYHMKNIDEKCAYSIHVMEDITEAKRAEEKIKQEIGVTTNLLMISGATAHTADIDKLMEHVVQCSHRIMHCDICLSYIWDTEAEVFMPNQAVGLAHSMMSLFRTETIGKRVDFVKKALDRGESVIKQFGVESSEFTTLTAGSALQWIKDINTMVVIPLIGRKDYLGLIIAGYKKHREFSERDKRIFEGISHQVSIVLEEARLYRDSIDRAMELTHKIETIQAMYEIDRAILSTLDPQAILDTAFIVISKVIPCERAAVALVNKEKGELIYEAGFGVPFLQKGTYIPFEDTSATDVIKTGRPQYVANLEKVKNILPIEKMLLEEGFLSHIRVPLIVKGEVIGLLIIGAKRPSAFTPENLSTLEKMASQISIALENARLISDLEDLFIATVKTLSSAIDAKSSWTAGHSERVTRYAIGIGKEMGLSEKELKDLELAGLLHDIGKIGTFDIILDKPGRLDSEEYEIVKKHPGRGVELLEPIKQLRHITPWIRHHHEQYDGTGYPDGLKGEEIPLMARTIAVADTFDSMTAERPYRETPGRERAIDELKRCSGSQFDPKVVEAFLEVLKGKTEYGS